VLQALQFKARSTMLDPVSASEYENALTYQVTRAAASAHRMTLHPPTGRASAEQLEFTVDRVSDPQPSTSV
jgi:hypothetical protein